MDSNIQGIVKACLNRYTEDGRRTQFTKHNLIAFSKGDTVTLLACLHEWQAKGYLQIVKPLAECQDDDVCIEMKSFIEMKSPLPGFLNWQ